MQKLTSGVYAFEKLVLNDFLDFPNREVKDAFKTYLFSDYSALPQETVGAKCIPNDQDDQDGRHPALHGLTEDLLRRRVMRCRGRYGRPVPTAVLFGVPAARHANRGGSADE